MRINSSITILGGLLATNLLAGCPDRTISEVDPKQGRVEYKDIPVTVNRDIDILFVIDDSPSMNDKQINLENNFPNFIDVLQTIPGGLPNLHLGVASSDMGTSVAGKAPAPSIGTGRGSCAGNGKAGALQKGMAGGTVTGAFISDVSTGPGLPRQTNYGDPSTLAAVFGQMARIGADGCGFEQHLEAAKAALSPATLANQGFLRQNAYLAIIFIADEDDCSIKDGALLGPESPTLGPLQSFRCNRFGHICDQGGADPTAMNQVGVKGQCHPADNSQYLTTVADYVDYFKKLKTDDQNVIVAGIMGTTTPYSVALRTPPGGTGAAQIAVADSCMYQGAAGLEVAAPPVRLQFLLDQFPARSTFTTICSTQLQDGLQLIAQLLKTVIGDPCITGNLADVDPTTDGDQYDCAVSFVQDQGKPTQTETVIPACNDAKSNKPCWYLMPDAECTEGAHVKLKVEGQESAPMNTHIIANCVTGEV